LAGAFFAVLAAGLAVALVEVFLAVVAAVVRLVAGDLPEAFAVDFVAAFLAAGLVLAVAVRRVDLAAAAWWLEGGRSTEIPSPLRWAIRLLR
jgi:hypothetical protein